MQPVTKEEVQALIDAAFAKAEALVGNPFFAAGLKMADSLIDNSPLPGIIAQDLDALFAAKARAAGLLK